MRRTLAIVSAAILIVGLCQTLHAQIAADGSRQFQQSGTSYPIAGSHLLWKNEQLLREKAAQHPEMQAPKSLHKVSSWGFTVGSTKQWYAHDFVNNNDYLTSSTCRAVGMHCYIFVEDSMWTQGRVNQNVVDSVRIAFDQTTPADPLKGTYQMDVDAYGNPPDVDLDSLIIILILNIRDGYSGSGGFVAGYFYSLNEYITFPPDPPSNHAEIYYLDAKPLNLTSQQGLSQGMQTTAHEFQHMIHWNYDPNEIAFVNEGCSLIAEVNAGYPIYDQSGYINETDHYLLDWRFNDNTKVLNDYSRASRFFIYVHDQLGMGVFKQIVASTLHGIAGLNDAFTKYGTSLRFNDLFTTWPVANILDDITVDPRYGYIYPNLPTANGTVFSNPNVSVKTDSVQRLAVSNLFFSSILPLSLQATFTVTNPLILISAVETGLSAKRVLPVTPGVPFTEPQFGNAYTDITFVVRNTDSSSNANVNYTYQVSSGPAAVDGSPSAIPASYSLAQNYPNPFNPSTTIRFSLAKAGPVTLKIFNLLGEEVGTLVRGEESVGEHSVQWAPGNLPSGVYVYQLQAGGFLESKKLVLLK